MTDYRSDVIETRCISPKGGGSDDDDVDVALSMTDTTIKSMVTLMIYNLENYYDESCSRDGDEIIAFIDCVVRYLARNHAISTNVILSLLLMITRNREWWSMSNYEFTSMKEWLMEVPIFHEIFLPPYLKILLEICMPPQIPSSAAELDITTMRFFTTSTTVAPRCLQAWVCMDNAIFIRRELWCRAVESNSGALELLATVTSLVPNGGPTLIQANAIGVMTNNIITKRFHFNLYDRSDCQIEWGIRIHQTKGELLAVEIVDNLVTKKRSSVTLTKEQTKKIKERFKLIANADITIVPGISIRYLDVAVE